MASGALSAALWRVATTRGGARSEHGWVATDVARRTPATRLLLAGGLAGILTGCGFGGGVAWSPAPIETVSATPGDATSSSAGPTSPSPGSPSPTTTPTKKPAKGTGSLKFFGAVGSSFVTTCQKTGGAPTLVMTDLKNEFFGAVEITTKLDAAGAAVARIDGTLAEDAEGNQWVMVYSASKKIKGTSAALKVSGSTYTVTGKAMMYVGEEKSEQLTPFTMVVKCASRDW